MAADGGGSTPRSRPAAASSPEMRRAPAATQALLRRLLDSLGLVRGLRACRLLVTCDGYKLGDKHNTQSRARTYYY